jgi:c(7)-type cytochrome triheme protein
MLRERLGKLTFWKTVLAALFGVALWATWVRFARGLGAATHLTDAFPWGLWIGFDVLVGVGVAAGGFVVAATVHIFRIEKYEAIARPAVLTAFLGYLLVIVALLFDLGRPYRIWHPLIMWNPHSVMFEVAWCVTLYTTVLALEFSPIVFERFGLKKPLRVVRAIYVPLVIAGVLLSTMHQSSLGTLYVIVPDKLHGLWYTPFLPVFFFISAIAAGLAMAIFESFMSWRAFGKRLEAEILDGIGRVIVVVLAVYAVWRFEDLAGRGALRLAFEPTPESTLFWGEVGLGVILPIVLFAMPRVRRSDQGLFFAAVLTVMGFVVNRLNVAITGMEGWSQAGYFPSWMEIAVTVSLVGAGFALFALAVKHLPVFAREGSGAHAVHAPIGGASPIARERPAFEGRALAGLWGLLGVGVAAVAFTLERGAPSGAIAGADSALADAHAAPAAVASATDLVLPEDYTFPQSDNSPGPVAFSHWTHVDAAEPDCGACHATLFRLHAPGMPIDDAAASKEEPAGGWFHEELCGSCHDGEAAFDVDEGCEMCHAQ